MHKEIYNLIGFLILLLCKFPNEDDELGLDKAVISGGVDHITFVSECRVHYLINFIT